MIKKYHFNILWYSIVAFIITITIFTTIFFLTGKIYVLYCVGGLLTEFLFSLIVAITVERLINNRLKTLTQQYNITEEEIEKQYSESDKFGKITISPSFIFIKMLTLVIIPRQEVKKYTKYTHVKSNFFNDNKNSEVTYYYYQILTEDKHEYSVKMVNQIQQQDLEKALDIIKPVKLQELTRKDTSINL